VSDRVFVAPVMVSVADGRVGFEPNTTDTASR
jgi:hypothetical protein